MFDCHYTLAKFIATRIDHLPRGATATYEFTGEAKRDVVELALSPTLSNMCLEKRRLAMEECRTGNSDLSQRNLSRFWSVESVSDEL